MTIAQILDRAFRLYRNNFLLFAGIAMLPGVLDLVLSLLGLMGGIGLENSGLGVIETTLHYYEYHGLVFVIAWVLGGGLATGASAYAVYMVHLGRRASIHGSYRKVEESWFSVIVIALAVTIFVVVPVGLAAAGLVVGVIYPLAFMVVIGTTFNVIVMCVGVLLVFLLWLYLYSRFAFAVPAAVLEKASFRSFKRSVFLSRGSVWRILLIILLTVLLGWGLRYALTLLAYWIHTYVTPWVHPALYEASLFGVAFLTDTVAGPVATIAISLVYIDQRIRKEAFDLEIMMETVQQSATLPSPEAAQNSAAS